MIIANRPLFSTGKGTMELSLTQEPGNSQVPSNLIWADRESFRDLNNHLRNPMLEEAENLEVKDHRWVDNNQPGVLVKAGLRLKVVEEDHSEAEDRALLTEVVVAILVVEADLTEEDKFLDTCHALYEKRDNEILFLFSFFVRCG